MMQSRIGGSVLDENGTPVYNNLQEMFRSTLFEASTYLENYTAQNDTMHRQRVNVGNGQYKWVQGRTHDELNDAIVQAYIDSGRIREFITIAQTPLSIQTDFKEFAEHIQTNFKEFAEQWFATYKTNLKPLSQNDYRYQLEHILYPTFGRMTLQDISINNVQEFLNANCDVAKSTLRKSLLILGQLYKLALKEHLVTENPIDTTMLKIVSDDPEERKALSVTEFLDVASHMNELPNVEDRRLLSLMMYTGMRRGEVLGVRWDDINFDTNIITVSRNVTFPGNDPVVGTPKTKKGYRQIPLDARLLPYLEPRETEGFVIGGAQPITKTSFVKRWRRIKGKVNLYDATPHSFRHTYATLLNDAGVPMKTIQVILGHADISTTMNIYTHTDTNNILDAGDKFSKYTAAQTLCTGNGQTA